MLLMENMKKARSASKRVTICLDNDLDFELRKLQAKGIKYTNGSYSFSRIVNETLRKGLKWQ
jgi:hypothetical protein